MQIVKFLVSFPFGKIKLAAHKNSWVGRHRQFFLRFLSSKRWKLREKFEAPFAYSLAHGAIAHVREKYERSRRAELLTLKKQRCPGPEQKQRSHGAISSGRRLETQPLARRRIRDLIVILDKRDEGLRRRLKCWRPTRRFLTGARCPLKQVAVLGRGNEFLR